MAKAEIFCVVRCNAFHATHITKHESEFIWRQVEALYFVLSRKTNYSCPLDSKIFRYCRTIYKTFCLYKHR